MKQQLVCNKLIQFPWEPNPSSELLKLEILSLTKDLFHSLVPISPASPSPAEHSLGGPAPHNAKASPDQDKSIS